MEMILPRSLAAEVCATGPAGELCETAGETVLVVDELSVRLVLEDALQGLAYTYLSAHDGAECLRMIEANDAIDLVVSDG